MTAPNALPVVAWADDGTHASNGTTGPETRIVSDKTLRNMPASAVAAYTIALTPLADAQAAIAALQEQVRALEADAQRFRLAIKYEDNAEALYGVCLEYGSDADAVRAEFDAAAVDYSARGKEPTA